MPSETNRVWTRLTPEKYQQMEAWAEQLGMSLAQFVALSAWVGARQVMRTLEPETFFTTEQWGQVIAAAVDRLPDEYREEYTKRILQEAKAEEASVRLQQSGILDVHDND